MRSAFFETLLELAERDRRVTLVVGDLGFGFVEPFAAKCPAQFVNAGVAEQNMTGLAAGLALAGRVVFTYSIANFPTLRCLEQLRNDICYHQLAVKVVAVGAGYTYGSLGMSHHATEDVAVMRSLPGMRVITPADPVEARLATSGIAAIDGPCYLRLGRSSVPILPPDGAGFVFGKATLLREGDDVTLVATGELLGMTMAVADLLLGVGVRARVLSMHSVHPIDDLAIRRAAAETLGVVTIEEHSIVGGLGSAAAEVIAELPAPRGVLIRIGLEPRFSEQAGSQQYLRQLHGLSEHVIFGKIMEALATWKAGTLMTKAMS